MVLSFKRVDSDLVSAYALYGKLPNRADFLRVNANHPVVVELDTLVQRSLERFVDGRGWLAQYDAGTPTEFQYVSSDARHVFTGVIAPSSDQAGRRYPLIAGVILPQEDVQANLHTAPIAYEVFFDGLRDQVTTARENSVEALSCIQFLESQVQSRDAAVADLELAQRVVDLHMRNTSIRRLRDLLAERGQSGQLEQLLLNLLFYRTFLRRFSNPSTNLAFLLPLPAQRGEQALIASTWLSLLYAIARDGGGRWCGNYFIFREQGRVGLAACFSSMHERIAGLMLGSVPDADVLLDLANEQEAWKRHRLYAEVSYALDRLLADSSLSLTELCGFLHDAACQLEKGG
jgi:type VI secretion system protein ImpM